MTKIYSYLLASIGVLLFLQACTTEPKLQMQSTLKRDYVAPLKSEWKNGVIHTEDGHTVTRSEDERTYRIKSYKNGKKDGVFGMYPKEPYTQLMETRYVNGVKEGISRLYGVDTPYVNGEKEGIEREYKKDSFMIRSTPYRKDKKHGVEQKFSYTSGKLDKRITYDMGTRKKIEQYCGNKMIKLRAQMDGCLHGMEKVWYCNPHTLKSETPYRSCKRHGMEKTYDKQGNIIYTVSYNNGLKEGTVKEYYPNGKLKYQVTYHADKVDEVGYTDDKNGKKERIDYNTIIKFSDRLPVSVEY